MFLRKLFSCLCTTSLLLCGFLLAPAFAAQVAFDVPLATPKLQSLTTSVAASGGAVNVFLALEYDVKGGLVCAAGSTIDGQAATCTGTQKNTASGWTFSFSVKDSTTTPKTTLTISGTGGVGTAKCVYNGPKGKANIAANSVTIVSSNPTANVTINASTLLTGKMSGTGTVVSGYGNDTPPGKVTGSVSKTGKASWTLTQGKGKVSFAGTTTDETTWTGTITATLPPAKTVVTGFSMTSIPIPPQGTANFNGTLSKSTLTGIAPADAAIVTISTDRDKNGKISSKETRTVYTDSEGKFSTAFDVITGFPVIVKFAMPGYAAATKVYASVTPGSTVTSNGTFAETSDILISDKKARSDDGKLTITKLPANVERLSGRVFNPKTETNQFPGEFADSTGKRLVSSVFGTVDARDGAGKPVKTLTSETTIKMLVPKDTWPSMKDLFPGSGKIDVPLYYFDEDSGQWKRGPNDGWLVTDADDIIPESDLAAIQAGTYDGSIYATGKIPHFSYWNVDWPVDTHTCICGRIVSAPGVPVVGATVSVRGVTYTGSTSPQVTGVDGTFCADVMRSELPGEDIDGNGTTGNTNRAEITVNYQDKYHLYGPYDLPTTQATCPGSGCDNVGDLSTTTNEITPTVCAVNGKVVYSGTSTFGASSLNKGDPIQDAFVYASDPDASDALYACIMDPVPCSPWTTSASDGTFSLTSPVLTQLQLFAIQSNASTDPHKIEYYEGQMSIPRCTAETPTVNADYWGLWFLTATMYDSQLNNIGSINVWSGNATIYLAVGTTIYMAFLETGVPEIAGMGPWFQANLQKIGAGGLTDWGTISLTVTGQDPETKQYTGALTTSRPVVTGATWVEGGFGTGKSAGYSLKDLKDAKARMKDLKSLMAK